MTAGELLVIVGAKIDGFKSAMGDVSSTATNTASTASAAASKINQVFSAAFGTGVTALAFSAANKFESAFAQIQRSTGATAEKLEGLEESFKNVYKRTAASSEDVAAALSILSTRTGAAGKDLEDLTLKTIKLAKTQREDLNTIVPLVTRAFGDWSIATQDQGKAMDYMRSVSQQTGTSVARLAEQVVYAGAPLRQLGYNFEQSTALIGKFEKEGVNTELVLGGMKAALQKFAREGVTDTAQAWQDFVKGVRDGGITLQDVMKEVGAKRGVDLFRAITEGRFEVDEMTKSAKKLADEGGAGIETFKTKFTKLQHEVETVIAGHYQLITAVGLTWPVISLLGGGFKTMAVGAVGAISNIVTAFQLSLIPALTLAEKAMLGFGIALAPLLSGALVGALQNLQNSIDPNSRVWGILLALREVGAAAGLDTGLGPQAKPRVNQADYVNTLVAPKETPNPKPGGGGGGNGLDEKEIKKAFSELGIHDLQGQLEHALEAFNKLKGAGQLSEAWQIKQATDHITDLRAKMAELAAGWREMPKASADLLKTVDDLSKSILSDPSNATARLKEMGSALAELATQSQKFVGPKIGPEAEQTVAGLTRAFQEYAHAAAVANSEASKKIDTVPNLEYAKSVDKIDTSFTNAFSSTSLYIKTAADLNQELREHNNVLRALPEQHHALAAAILDPLAAIKGITDAFHYFNIKTPAELQAHAAEAKRQYDIIKNAAGSAATAAQIAWHKSVLAQIELDHALGITDEELYNQRKKMAEDALKTLEGNAKSSTDVIRRHTWSAADDMKHAMSGAFDSMYRNLGDALVHWKGFGDAAKQTIQNLASDMLSTMIKVFMKPLEDMAVKLAGKVAGALGTAAGNATSAAGSVGGSVAESLKGVASSVTSITNMVSGLVTAAASVISAVTTMRLEGTMNAVEHNTRYMQIQFEKFAQQDEWAREQHLMEKLDDIWNEIRNVVSAVRGQATGGGISISTGIGGGVLETIRDYAVLQVRKIDEFIVPRMDTMIGLMGAGAAPAGNITIYVQGGDPAETARQVVSHLKRNGVYL